MPVLEAAACGLPVICTAGGATDDVVTEESALKIRSRLEIVSEREGGVVGKRVIPDLDHLVELIRQAINDQAWRQRAGAAGAGHVHSRFTWDLVTDRLVEAFRRMHERG